MTGEVSLPSEKLSQACRSRSATDARPAACVDKTATLRVPLFRGLVAPVLLGLLTACNSMADPAAASRPSAAASPLDVMMPPDEYIHPFQGKVTIMPLPHRAGVPLLSLSHHAAGQCAIWLPRVGDPGVTQALYECLAVIEVANCNGATDINMPAVKERMSFGDRVKYSRSCSGRSWDWAFDAVRQPAIVDQAANAVSLQRASPF